MIRTGNEYSTAKLMVGNNKLSRDGMFNAWKVVAIWLLFMIIMFPALALMGELPEQNDKPHIVFLISEDPDNYEAHKTIPQFADLLHRNHNFEVTVIQGEGNLEAFHFPGLEVLSEADLLVIFFRRIALPYAQLDIIKRYLNEGKPLVGIRTANHAFSVRGEVPEGYQAWWDFVPEILGCENRGYGSPELGTEVSVMGANDHPILKNIEPAQWHSAGNVYHVAPLLDDEATVLLIGREEEKVEPIAWTRFTADESRVFYTSLGYPKDFNVPQFRNLLVNGIYWALDQNAPK